MTDEQISAWKRERDIAREIKDPEERRIALEKVYDHRDEMQMTCIAHQSKRVKDMTSDMAAIKKDIEPLKKTQREINEKKVEARGAMKMLKVIKWVAAIGGGALLPHVIEIIKQLPF